MRIPRSWLAAAAFGAALFARTDTSEAMQFRRVQLDGGGIIVQSVGEIIPGDMDRLREFLGNLPAADRIFGFALDSPGGNVEEAERFAAFIHAFHATVGVTKGSQCLSACFLVFAAGANKVVASDALIGVHSASDDGQETPQSMAVTTAMARDVAAFGVPPAIIGKMVQAALGRMEWLTHQDLASMGVRVLEPEPSPSPATVEAPAPQPAPGDTVGSLQVPQPAPEFQQGLADRRNWETWFAGLTGDYRSGAEYWASHRSLPRPGSCYSSSEGQTPGDWVVGCLAAQGQLARSDVRRKAEPEYRRGWNSY